MKPVSEGLLVSEQTDTLLTRERLAALLREEGLVLTARTLRYWETSGKMPRAKRVGRQVAYDYDIIPLARMLAATRPGMVAELREHAKISDAPKGRPSSTMTVNGSSVILTIHYGRK
jgi:hypothetical protein